MASKKKNNRPTNDLKQTPESSAIPDDAGFSAPICRTRKQLVRRKPCLKHYFPQQLVRRPMDTVHEIRNRRLAYPQTICKGGLRDVVLNQIGLKCFHQPVVVCRMSAEGIGFAYRFAIGQTYLPSLDNGGMAKTHDRSFLDRAIEALGERYPREKPTQVRLAKLAGVAQPSVYEWGEVGRSPVMPTGVRLAKALGVCVEWLYTERGPKRPGAAAAPDEHLSPILEAWPDLPAEIRRQVARYTDFIKGDSKPE